MLYDMVCFSTTNYVKSLSFHSSHYFNSPLNLQLHALVELYQKKGNMDRYGFRACPLYEWGGGSLRFGPHTPVIINLK